MNPRHPAFPACKRTGFAANNTIIQDTAVATAWAARWQREFRYTRWIETRHGLVPAPGWEHTCKVRQ